MMTCNIFILGFLLQLFVLCYGTFRHGQGDHWGYEPWNGPRVWPHRFPDECAGYFQSPINIDQERTIFSPKLTPFRFHQKYKTKQPYRMFNNGETLRVNVTTPSYISGGGLPGIFRVEQIHFHWGDKDYYGSEHTVDKKRAPIEMHIVLWDSTRYGSFSEASDTSEGVAVFSVLFKLSPVDNPLLDPIVRSLHIVQDPDLHYHVDIPAIPIHKWLPKKPNMYYRYKGSFTTPTCHEGVLWTLFYKRQYISHRQLNAFRHLLKNKHFFERKIFVKDHSSSSSGYRLLPGYESLPRSRLVNNFRPLQPLDGRHVYRSF